MQIEPSSNTSQFFKDHDEIDPNYEEKLKKKLAFLDKLPQTKIAENQDQEHAIRVSIELSMKKDGGEEYFISKTLKNFKEKKENLLTDDALQAMLKKFELDEYATNLDQSIFNPKKLLEEVLEIEDQKKKVLQYQQTKKTPIQNLGHTNFYSRYQVGQLYQKSLIENKIQDFNLQKSQKKMQQSETKQFQ